MSCCDFRRVSILVLGGQNTQYVDSLGQCATNHHLCRSSSLRYDMISLVDEKFRGFYAIGGESVAIRILVEVDDAFLVRVHPRHKCHFRPT